LKNVPHYCAAGNLSGSMIEEGPAIEKWIKKNAVDFQRMWAAVAFVTFFLSLTLSGRALSSVDLYTSAGLSRIVGESEAPEFVLKTVDGQDLDRRALKGKVVLVNFWATWCGPCKDEMPTLERLQQSLNGENFMILAITADDQREAIKAFSKTQGLTFPILLDAEKDVGAAFGVRGLPTSFLIDREGRLVGRAVGPLPWDGPNVLALIRSLLKP